MQVAVALSSAPVATVLTSMEHKPINIQSLNTSEPPSDAHMKSAPCTADPDTTFDIFVKNHQHQLKQAGFNSNTKLNTDQSFGFYQNILSANNWVLSELHNIHTPESKNGNLLPVMSFSNNKSALAEMPRVVVQVGEGWLHCDSKSKLYITNPLTMASRVDSQTGEIKYRVFTSQPFNL